MSTVTNQTILEDEKETGRIEAFSDCVFSIAITLLILEIKVPPAADVQTYGTLLNALLRQWPSYLAYVLSFMSVLIMWMNHHKLFRHIHRSDHLFLVLNGLLLMAVTVVPFPTALLAAFITGAQGKTAAAVYSGVFLIIAILFHAVWSYASYRNRLLARTHDVQSVAAISRQYRFGPLMYLIALLLAFVSVWASVGMCMALAVFFLLPGVKKDAES